ncbi:8-amino-7-oxononanoate synthase [Chitinophaga costaii]|uniref:8-amino-7-oxononanoate synthase n=1 Tax=Chitinophaga costaii TaxID=1335309 RepID=A0A1C3YVU8_9BACT|nr:8-amino-7-oxononanoate synthase [Chitinophaga costaii]PUZ30121.1 8-amino-7-oxononanoate synthase [Chitinophaga costaii]SCB74152.1 8-amino-7-oxononanoate synthase [Chitinophaga costaii]
MQSEEFLHAQLDARRAQHAFRTLSLPVGQVDFCSNDYLGLAASAAMQAKVQSILAAGDQRPGSTGSRLLAGNYAAIMAAETQLAAFHQASAGLLFNAGYDANVGLFSCVPQKGDTIVYDALIHASIRDGIRLSRAQAFSFVHNDLEDLRKKVGHGSGRVFVAVESVYSMDGDQAPLAAMAALCRETGAYLIVDEAHATGVIGAQGEGLVQHLGLVPYCFARVHTFGKAVGCHGAIVLGSALLRDYLINFSRSFIYTTALPPASIAAIVAAYSLFPGMDAERLHLQQLIVQLREALPAGRLLPSQTPIQPILAPGNVAVRRLAEQLQAGGLDVRAILHPTVPKGQERLRVVLHSFNTRAEVARLIEIVRAGA